MHLSNNRVIVAAISTISFICVRSANAGPPASPATVQVSANIQGVGNVNIGTMTVDDHANDPGEFMMATFDLNATYAHLAEWYNFRWMNVVMNYTDNGSTEDYDGDGNNDMSQFDTAGPSPPFMELPAIDPVAGPFTGDEFYNDGAPFYFTDTEYAERPNTASAKPYSDSKGTHAAGVVMTFRTYLIAQSGTDPALESTTLCLLAAFEWTSAGTAPGPNPPGNDEVLTALIAAPGAGDVTLITSAITNAGPAGDHADNGAWDDGDFATWSTSADCTLISKAGFKPPNAPPWWNDENCGDYYAFAKWDKPPAKSPPGDAEHWNSNWLAPESFNITVDGTSVTLTMKNGKLPSYSKEVYIYISGTSPLGTLTWGAEVIRGDNTPSGQPDSAWIGKLDTMSKSTTWAIWAKGTFKPQPDNVILEFTMPGGGQITHAWAGECCRPGEKKIPTVSQWGLIVMTLLLLAGAKVYFNRRAAGQSACI